MDKDRLQTLLRKYFNNTISPEDCEALLTWLDEADHSSIDTEVDRIFQEQAGGPVFSTIQSDNVYDRIKRHPDFTQTPSVTPRGPGRFRLIYQASWFRAAAVVIVILSLGIYLVTGKRSIQQPIASADTDTVNQEILPANGKATLTLANGAVISLDSTKNGVITNVAGTVVGKTNGQLTYSPSGKEAAANTYNTLATAKGSEYQLVLPDGTKVWLNASSSLRFPVHFNGKERAVMLTGEAYFEVARNEKMPFRVMAKGAEVQVLGTHFNVAAYDDENTFIATLLEGRVKVTRNGEDALLSPGQQATIQGAGNKITLSAANVTDVMAWKNGYFKFNNEDIRSIMRKISRWYDIEVEYEGTPGNQRFGGTFYRSKSLTELLRHLETLGDVRFEITGKKIVVKT